MREPPITEADVERMKRAFALYNEGDYDALREFVSPDVVMTRVGDMPPIQGWEAFRRFQEPDAFEWQRISPLEWTINDNRVLLRIRISSKGAVSGVELEVDGWMVWTVENRVVVLMENFIDEAEAREAAGLGHNASP
jgi:ketosteroid isomerase-like protein